MNDFTYIDKNIINKERFLSSLKNEAFSLIIKDIYDIKEKTT